MPAWLRYPDRERVGWVNDILSQLWPQVAAAAAVMVRTRVSLPIDAGLTAGFFSGKPSCCEVVHYCGGLQLQTGR